MDRAPKLQFLRLSLIHYIGPGVALPSVLAGSSNCLTFSRVIPRWNIGLCRRSCVENFHPAGLYNLLKVVEYKSSNMESDNWMLNSLNCLLIVACLTISPLAVAQRPVSDQLLTDVERYRAQLEVLEEEVGRYHPSLLEGLERLATVLVELDQFNETDEVLDRAIQILRINEGLYTDSQFPFQVLSIRNNVRRGNWPDANETLDHLVRLYTFVPRQWDEELINELVQLSDLHLEGVAGDFTERKDYHFRAADRISWMAAQIGERVWQPNDLRLVDLYYQLLKQNHMKFVTLNQGGSASADLRQLMPNSGWMRPRRAVSSSYFRLGIEMLRRMRTVYELQETPDLEAAAMVDVYRADWQVLFDESDPEISYRMAYENLLAAGVEEQVLQSLFSRPQPLPIAEFHSSVQQARTAMLADTDQLREAKNILPHLRFLEWASTSPNLQLPIREPLLLQQEIEDMVTAQVVIRLDGTEKVSRWIRGRYVSQISVTDGFDWLNRSPEQAISREELAERLHYLNFRPVLDQGVPQSYEGVLEYRYFPVDRE